MSTATRNKQYILMLYRMLIRESRKFPAYSFRKYFTRRVQENFRENQHLTDAKEIQNKIQYAEQSLQMIRRQVVIGHMYGADKLAVEK